MLYRDFATQEAIDDQYDPARSADAPAAIGAYRAASEATRAELTHRTLAYGPTRAEYLDFFAAGAGAPLHVFFHGGYWRALASEDFAFIARALVPAGVSVAIVNYALCPAVTLGEIVRQCRASLAWLYDHAAELDVDAGRISVSGHSAGGQIVGMLLATDWPGDYDRPADLIRGATAISGLFDLAPFPYSWLQPKLQLTGREVAALSPLHRPVRADCPVALVVGGEETAEFHRQSDAYADHLRAAGRDVARLDVAGRHHFSVIDAIGRGEGPLYEAIRARL